MQLVYSVQHETGSAINMPNQHSAWIDWRPVDASCDPWFGLCTQTSLSRVPSVRRGHLKQRSGGQIGLTGPEWNREENCGSNACPKSCLQPYCEGRRSATASIRNERMEPEALSNNTTGWSGAVRQRRRKGTEADWIAASPGTWS